MRTLSVICMAAGYILLVVEMFIPGFGVPGITGIACAVGGLILFGPTLAEGLIIGAVFLVLLLAALVLCVRSASKGRLSKSRFVLHDVDTKAVENANEDLIGAEGKTLTPLRPTGMAMMDGKRVEVTTEGGFIAADTAVKVIRTEGKRVIVRAL